jgi:CheY-like chemotaxis protein
MGGQISVKSEEGVGTEFKVRLFLPSTVIDDDLSLQTMNMPIGYKGRKRKLLVVDNEPIDRELLINILSPLGFEIKEVASGAECLKLYPDYQPEIIFMDLAMPEMDGWETINLLRNIHKSEVTIGIISANAFDTNLENISGITEKDFILKPLNLLELINWIGERLKIEWIEQEGNKPSPLQASSIEQLPPIGVLNSLLEMIDMGYMQGIRKIMSELGQQGDGYDGFIVEMQQMSEGFELEIMKKFIEGKLNSAR